MARRILLINTVGTDVFDEPTHALVAPTLPADTELVVESLGDSGVPAGPFISRGSAYHGPLIARVERAGERGFDAVVIACASDPALAACKRATPIPVTAPMEAACAAAVGLGRVSVLVTRRLTDDFDHDPNWVPRLFRQYGAHDLLASVRMVDASDPSLGDDTGGLDTADAVHDRFAEALARSGVDQARAAYHEDHAEALFFACTHWSGQLDRIRRAVPIPVLDPLVNTVQYARMLAFGRYR